MGPALQGIFVGQGPRALPGVRGKTGRRGEGTLPYGGVAGKCLRGSRADRGVRPYGWFARSLWGGRPRGSPLRTGTRSACVIGGRGRTPPLRSAWQGVPWAGRCGERTERCRWQMQRGERVAAVKISSVRCKAARKFWAPQQDHRPLRRPNYSIYSCARQIKNTDHFRRNKT